MSDSTINKQLNLKLGKTNFTLSVPAEEIAQLEAAERVFNERYNELFKKHAGVEISRLYCLLGLMFAQEIIKLQGSLQAYENGERCLQKIVDDLDKQAP